MIRGGGLAIHASDVLVQHIRVRVGDDKVGPAFDNRVPLASGLFAVPQSIDGSGQRPML